MEIPPEAERRIADDEVAWLTTGALQMTVAALDAQYDTRIRIRPTRVRLTPG